MTTTSAIELFGGPGGWAEACKNLGIEETGVEFDASACNTRRAAGHKTIEADVTTLEPEWYPADGLIASPPCQTFSTAGKGNGRAKLPLILEAIDTGHFPPAHKDGKTELVVEPLRWILDRHRAGYPYRWVAMEQVPTVLPVWEAYAKRLRELGYFVWVGKLNAEQYGVPQTRTRAFLLADLDWEVAAPKPTHSRYYPRDKTRLDVGVKPWVSMAEALGWGMTKRPSMTVCAGGTATGGAEVFGNGARQGMVRELDAGHWAFRRPSTTVNCDPRISAPGRHDPNVPGSQQKDAIRVTVQEAGVLQSFPADYPWQGTKGKQYEQVGNAVPPVLSQAVLSVICQSVASPTVVGSRPVS